MSTPLLPLPLQQLLADLESPSPTIRELPCHRFSSDGFGDYFRLRKGEEQVPCDKQWWAVRLRLVTAIGNCRTLTKIRLHDYSQRTRHVVQEEEARALLKGLLCNPVLEKLWLYGWDGFGTVAACVVLACILRWSRTLRELDLRYVGMTSEELGHIAAALDEANSRSPLKQLALSWDQLGDVSAAQHLALILTTSRTLEVLHIYEIQAMDVVGATVIAKALAQNTTLKELNVQSNEITGSNESAALTKLVMGALSGQLSASHGTPTSPAFNHSITTLQLMVWKMAGGGGAGLLGEAVQQMLASNTTLTKLGITANFLRFGLDAGFTRNTTITDLQLWRCLDDDVKLEMLIPILRSSRTLEKLDLSWLRDAPASFKRAFFIVPGTQSQYYFFGTRWLERFG